MTNTEIIYASQCNKDDTLHNLLEECKSNCFICGKPILQGIKTKNIISSSFTNWSEVKNIHEEHVCKECASCIKDVELRRNSFLSDKNKLYLLKKNDLENYLFNIKDYVKDEFVIGITTSFKKHNSFRCKINNDFNRYYIRQEDKEFLFDSNELKSIYDILNIMYLQFSKDELQSGKYKIIGIEQFGTYDFARYENILKQYRNSNQFNLLIYILNSERRNEIIQEKIKERKLKKNGK